MIIEYVGLPGAGKTFESARESDRRSVPLIKIESRSERYLWAITYALHHPLRFCGLIFFAVKENRQGIRMLYHKLSFLLFRAIAQESKAEWSGGIIDDGLLQLALTLFDRPVSDVDIERVLRFLPESRDREVVLVEAPKELRDKRMVMRGRIPRAMLGAEAQASFLRTIEYNAPIVFQALSRRYGVRRISSL